MLLLNILYNTLHNTNEIKMKFQLYTLIDITETHGRRGDADYIVNQQQNFLTVLQTIGLRVNPIYSVSPIKFTDKPINYKLGSAYKDQHQIWSFIFEIEHENALSVEMLRSDFNLIPIILGLDETAPIKIPSFNTLDKKMANIHFDNY